MRGNLEVSEQGLAFFYRAPELEDTSRDTVRNEAFSQRVPIITLHGLLGSHKNFASFGKYFSACGHPVVCVDIRNHGASMRSEDFDYPLLAQDLEALLAWLEQQNYAGQDWSRVVVLGHSMGGRAAMLHALLYPKRLAALVSVDVVPSLQNPDLGIARIVEAMRVAEGRIATVGKRKEAEDILRAELESRGSNSEAILQFLLLCNLHQENGTYRWASNLPALDEHLADIVCWPNEWLEENWGHYAEVGRLERVCNFELPVLLVAGGRSPYVEEQGWQLLLEYFPDSEGAPTIKSTIGTAYHWPHTEAAQEFQSCVLEFLAAYT